MKRFASVLITCRLHRGRALRTAGAQAPARSVTQGVYTADQAKRGEGIYKEQCAACHGDNLEGSGPMPALAGPTS